MTQALNSSLSCTYLKKLPTHNVFEILHSNRRNCEPYRNTLDEAFIVIYSSCSLEPEGEQENGDIEEKLTETQ